MKKIKLIILTALFLIATGAMAQERPSRVQAKRDPIEIVQPDSSFLTIYLRGDEWHHVRMTIDGYVIMKNKKGFYCYARENCKGVIVHSCRVAKNPENRSKCDWTYLKRLDKNEKLKFIP